LDIDGVLNVGVGDKGSTAPLLLNARNCQTALGMKDLSRMNPQDRSCVEKLVSVASHEVGNQEPGTYIEYMCRGKEQFSEILLDRFAAIIRAAGDKPRVVLASNWRKPKYRRKVRTLEKAIAARIGSEFEFDDTTEVVSESGAADRLRCIGGHLREFCVHAKPSDIVRALVLDDFFVTPLQGWTCDGSKIRGQADVEAYLMHCVERPGLEIKLVHCYDEWQVNDSLRVEVGTGLTLRRMREAAVFLQAAPRRSSDDVQSNTTVGGLFRSSAGGDSWAQAASPASKKARMSNRFSSILSLALPSRPRSRATVAPCSVPADMFECG